jgi:asparagine synthetase B (glutamine-hydrolysing)
MCGIFCLISLQNNPEILLQKFKLFEKSLLRRGPNSVKTAFHKLKDSSVLIAASVLWLQGADMTIQPLEDDKSVLIYNGDIFGGTLITEELRQNVGDTKLFFEALTKSENVFHVLRDIQGPYAFVYINILDNKIYFGRDSYGRRSLLIGKNANEIIVTSVAMRHTEFEFIELPCIGIFSIDLKTGKWQVLPWKRKNKNFNEKLQEIELFVEQKILIELFQFKQFKSFSVPNKSQLEILEEIVLLPPDDVFCKLTNSSYIDNVLHLKTLLENSVRKRILSQPQFCQDCFKQYTCDHAVTGVLFSGCVDCAVLALLTDKFVEKTRPIDLINVAFEKEGSYNTPDRLTGLSTLSELQILCPERIWNFVEVNVTRQELDSCRAERISDLIYPLKSILDDSLGCALWFASRASTATYRSPCRTLLVGMGADELFGGYTKHRAAFQKRGWQGLHEILEEDWQNLPHRNLARDDRVVSDHGRQLRTPYLDEEVVDFIQSLNCWDKTFPSNELPQGIGEKILLRTLANYLDLKNAARLKKRALQFGSRIANPKENAHETSLRL